LINGDTDADFDITKLSVNTLGLGLAGIEVYDILRDEYDIQVEFGDIGNFLAYISVGDTDKNIERLISALTDIRRLYKKDSAGMLNYEYISPTVVTTPQEAFYAGKKSVSLENSLGEVCAENVMSYPPGIPILSPGERITKDIIDYIVYAKEKGCLLTGTEDLRVSRLNVLKGRK
ncbi:MAG: arginine decarboxylase, partial [Clostridiales bacterium]|nr:arginine decarboxylase [Clostridiales bacterium]